MVRGNEKSKLEGNDFVNSIRAGGQTNELPALQRGMQIRDSRWESASVIYFLTDGFELSGENMWWFGLQVENIRKRLAVGAQINTIGFWPQDEDRKMLELMAAESGGQAVFVDER